MKSPRVAIGAMIMLAGLTSVLAGQNAAVKTTKVSAKPHPASSARTQPPTPEKVASYVREKFGVPGSIKVTSGSLDPSPNPDYYQVTVTTDDGKKTNQQSLAVSKDGRYLVVGGLVPLNGDVDAAIVQVLRDQFKLPATETLTPGALHPSRYPADFLITTVTASNGTQSQAQDFFVTLDKKFMSLGGVFEFNKDPRKEALRIISLKDQPTQGPANAPVTIVEYADLECPSCARMHQYLENEFLPKYKDKVRVVFKEFPLPMHPWGAAGAIANECAYQIDASKYVPYRSLIFQHQSDVDAVQANTSQVRDLLLSYGQQVGLDRGKLGVCFDAQTSKSRVDAGHREGEELNVNQTPTLFINGKLLAGPPPDVLIEVVEDALKSAK